MEDQCFQDIKNILVPLDGSKLSENALRYGVTIAKKFNSNLIILSVFSSKNPDSIFKQRIKEMNPELAEGIKKMPLMLLMETYQDILKNTIKKHEISIKSILREKNISTRSVTDVMLEVIKDEKIDLIIMSSYGRSGFQKLKAGSVTEELMKIIKIPILIVK